MGALLASRGAPGDPGPHLGGVSYDFGRTLGAQGPKRSEKDAQSVPREAKSVRKGVQNESKIHHKIESDKNRIKSNRKDENKSNKPVFV